MLIPSVSNTINKNYQKIFNFVNTDTPCRKKTEVCLKTFIKTVTQGDSKNSLTMKLLANVSFAIFHKKQFFVKLLI